MGPKFDLSETKCPDNKAASETFIVFKLFDKHDKAEKQLRFFQCKHPKCNRIIMSPSKFFDHLRSHTNERRFKCEKCDLSFVQKTNLIQH